MGTTTTIVLLIFTLVSLGSLCSSLNIKNEPKNVVVQVGAVNMTLIQCTVDETDIASISAVEWKRNDNDTICDEESCTDSRFDIDSESLYDLQLTEEADYGLAGTYTCTLELHPSVATTTKPEPTKSTSTVATTTPEATKTPEPTKVPETTTTPKVTKVPEASTPEPTKAPEASTPEPTKAPEASTPEPTKAPEASTPEPTKAPEASTPEPTKAPEASTPEPIEGTEATKTPEGTTADQNPYDEAVLTGCENGTCNFMAEVYVIGETTCSDDGSVTLKTYETKKISCSVPHSPNGNPELNMVQTAKPSAVHHPHRHFFDLERVVFKRHHAHRRSVSYSDSVEAKSPEEELKDLDVGDYTYTCEVTHPNVPDFKVNGCSIKVTVENSAVKPAPVFSSLLFALISMVLYRHLVS